MEVTPPSIDNDFHFDAHHEAQLLLQRIAAVDRSKVRERPTRSLPTATTANKLQVRVVDSARDYQLEVLKIALARDSICVLGTGLGKTFVAVMLAREILQQKRNTTAVMICPTAYLVEQQAEFFRANSNVHVRVLAYHGGASRRMEWTKDAWSALWSQYQVLVLTPQVLVNALVHGLTTLDRCSCLIIDECHHAAASRDHPMNQLMQRVASMDSKCRPRILGLTASPFLNATNNLYKSVSELESAMCGARLFTVDVSGTAKAPEERHVLFDNVFPFFGGPVTCRLLELFPNATDKSSKDRKNRQKVLKILSLWFNVSCGAARRYALAQQRKYPVFLTMARRALTELGVVGFQEIVREDESEFVQYDVISPKLEALLMLLHERVGKSEQLLVFVEQREVAFQLSIEITRRVGVSCDWLIGLNARSDSIGTASDMLDRFRRFRSGDTVCLVATSTAEEGIDVPAVATVVSYDGVKQVKSYVQMRGRCRFAHSLYVVYSADEAQHKRYLEAKRLEQDLYAFLAARSLQLDKEAFLDDDDDDHDYDSDVFRFPDEEFFVKHSGALVNRQLAVTLVNRFCQTLGKGASSARLEFEEQEFGGFAATLFLSNCLPMNLQRFCSPVFASKKSCKRYCCLQALRDLYAAGWLDDNLLPKTYLSLLNTELLSWSSNDDAVVLQNEESDRRIFSSRLSLGPTKFYKLTFLRGNEAAFLSEIVVDLPFQIDDGTKVRLRHPVAGLVCCVVASVSSVVFSDACRVVSQAIWTHVFGVCGSFTIGLLGRSQEVLERWQQFDAGHGIGDQRSFSCEDLWEFTDRGSVVAVERVVDATHVEACLCRIPIRLLMLLDETDKAFEEEEGRKKIKQMSMDKATRFWLPRDLFFSLECLPSVVTKMRLMHGALRASQHVFGDDVSLSSFFIDAVCPASVGIPSAFERLECLGDCLIKLLGTQRLVSRFPFDVSRLSEARSVLVSNEQLCRLFQKDCIDGSVDTRRMDRSWATFADPFEISEKRAADVVEALVGASFCASEGSVDRVQQCVDRIGFGDVLVSMDNCREPGTGKVEAPSDNFGYLVSLQDVIGYKFGDPSILLEAMTHSTARILSRNYDRLEMLGDSVVDLASLVFCLHHDPLASAAVLSDWRRACVCTETLARIGRMFELHLYVNHFSAPLSRELAAYCGGCQPERPSVWLDDAPKVLADLFEALVGAVYVDSGFNADVAIKLVLRLARVVWSSLIPNPPQEPLRELSDTLGSPYFDWDDDARSLSICGVVLSRVKGLLANWRRVAAWKVLQMIRADRRVKDEILCTLLGAPKETEDGGEAVVSVSSVSIKALSFGRFSDAILTPAIHQGASSQIASDSLPSFFVAVDPQQTFRQSPTKRVPTSPSSPSSPSAAPFMTQRLQLLLFSQLADQRRRWEADVDKLKRESLKRSQEEIARKILEKKAMEVKTM